MSLLMIPLILLTVDAFAQAPAMYRWYPSKTRFPEGDCIFTGTSSDGKEYVEKVKPEACRPAKTVFVWAKGQCYEMDEASQGQSFGSKADTEKCAPAETAIRFDPKSRQCWIVDKETGGEMFKRTGTKDECRPPDAELKKLFVPNQQRPVGGECLEVHKEHGVERWSRKLEVTECKPSETSYAWLATGALKGECWEMAPNDARAWSAPARNEHCKPATLSYLYKRTTETTGECFEVDAETQGQRWALKAPVSACLDK